MARSDNKTERPTPRRLRKARREGQIARSREIAVATSLGGALLGLLVVAPGAAHSVASRARSIFAGAGSADAGARLADHGVAMLVAGVAPFLVIAVVAGLAAGLAQSGFVWAPAAARPKLSHLSPRKGIQKFKPSTMGWELGRAALKLGLLALVAAGPVAAFVRSLAAPIGLGRSLALTWSQVGGLLVRATLLAAAIAAADYAVVRFRHSRDLKMTRQEVRDELKDSEGDPLTRAQRRRRQRELSRNRMIADVGTADVVITNPTHLAIALRYGAGYPAPQIVAKGAGRMAARIKTEAYRHGVPVFEDRPLARALYRRARVGSYVPAALYEAVATVLAAAYRRRRRVA